MNIGELYFNGVLRGPGNCIMDPGQAGAPNTPNHAPTTSRETYGYGAAPYPYPYGPVPVAP